MSTSPSGGRSLLQNAIYVGSNVENILYGVELVLYFRTMSILLVNRGAHRKLSLFYAIFSSIMVFLISVWVITSIIFNEKMWLLDTDFPGGFNAYWAENLSVWYLDWGTTAAILLQLMTDGLMIYRCLVIWNNYRVIVIPIFLWLSTLVLGILVDWTSSSPGGNLFTGVSSQLALAYYAVSVFLNTTLTYMVCYRIIRHGKKVREYIGKEHASSYFSVATLVVESVLPYTLSGIAFLVCLGTGSPISEPLLSVYVLAMCISPQMLILRVLSGRAWDNEAHTGGSSTIKFSPASMAGSQWVDGTETGVHLQVPSNTHSADSTSRC